jgi:ABC-type nitrate/sulfonate/bicarbonate transport system substrate-binding protein
MTQAKVTPPVDRLWYTRCPAPTPFGIAIQQGWLQEEFRAENIDVRALQDASDPAIRQSHYTHSQPRSFRQGGNIPALWARANGADTRVIGLSWVDEFQGLVALPSSGIHTPADLRGRRFGLPRNTRTQVVDFHRATALRGFVTLLDAVGLTLDDVELVELPTTPRGLADEPPVRNRGAAQLLATERAQEFSFEALATKSMWCSSRARVDSTPPISSARGSLWISMTSRIVWRMPITAHRARLRSIPPS